MNIKIKLRKRTIFLGILSLVLMLIQQTIAKDYIWIDFKEIIMWILLGIMILSFFIKEKGVGFMILGIALLIFYFSCLINYSKSINEIIKPMAQNVLAFYKKNQRYPNLEESEILLNKAGCTHIKQKDFEESKNKNGEVYEKRASYDCDYKFLTYHYGLSVGDLSVKHDRNQTENYPFRFKIRKTKSVCWIDFDRGGNMPKDGLTCTQNSCGPRLQH